MFLKSAAAKRMKFATEKIPIALICVLWMAALAMAQEPVETPLEEPKQEDEALPSGEGLPADQEPIPITTRVEEDTGSLGVQSFVDDVFQSTRNNWGFSLGAYQAYTTELAMGGEPDQGSGITAFMPRVFFNTGKRKSRFHIDLGAGYRLYNHDRDLDGWNYRGDAQYTYQFSRRTGFQLADQFQSAYNDAWDFLSPFSSSRYNRYYSSEVLFNRQRINRNLLMAELNHQATRKARFGVFGGYRMYDYTQDEMVDSNAIDLGGSFYYQLAKWLYVSSSFSTYLNFSGDGYPEEKIYRVQAGGLDFHLGKSWRIWGSGGVDVTDFENYSQVRENIDAGVGYTSRKAFFNATYRRGFTSAIGLSKLLQSNIVSLTLGYRFNRRVNAKLESYYHRSLEEPNNGRLETLTGGGGLEFSLRRDLIMTMNAYYQNQKTQSFSVEGLGLNRLTGYLGLQYVWPARRRSGS